MELDVQHSTSPAPLLGQKSAPVDWRQPPGKNLGEINSFPPTNAVIQRDHVILGHEGSPSLQALVRSLPASQWTPPLGRSWWRHQPSSQSGASWEEGDACQAGKASA